MGDKSMAAGTPHACDTNREFRECAGDIRKGRAVDVEHYAMRVTQEYPALAEAQHAVERPVFLQRAREKLQRRLDAERNVAVLPWTNASASHV